MGLPSSLHVKASLKRPPGNWVALLVILPFSPDAARARRQREVRYGWPWPDSCCRAGCCTYGHSPAIGKHIRHHRRRKRGQNDVVFPRRCQAEQPEQSTGHCILPCGHEGMHQTFVAEWIEGASNSRRRQPRQAGASSRIPQVSRPSRWRGEWQHGRSNA